MMMKNIEEYSCLLTKKKYKNLRSMLKNAIRTKLKQPLNQLTEQC